MRLGDHVIETEHAWLAPPFATAVPLTPGPPGWFIPMVVAPPLNLRYFVKGRLYNSDNEVVLLRLDGFVPWELECLVMKSTPG